MAAALKSRIHVKRKVSVVWNQFAKKAMKNIDGTDMMEEDGSVSMRAHCKICDSSYVFGGTNGTSHLSRHMKGCGRKSLNGGKQSIIGVDEDGEVYHFTFNKMVARCETVRYWVHEELPFNKIGKKSFKRWINMTFGPQFKPPCRTTLRNNVIETFNEEKTSLKELFSKVPGKVSLTSDLWTSNQKIGYMVITAHWISSDWTLQKRIISFVKLPYPHTGKAISEALYAELLSWGLNGKIGSIALDNATNNDSAISILKNLLFGNDGLRRDLVQLRCNAHVMNLVVKAGLKHVEPSLENIKKSLLHVSTAPTKLQKFHEACDFLSMKNKTLAVDVDTRWDSTYLMLEAALPYRKVFEHFFNGSKFENIPTENDWRNARVIKEFFKIFKETTKLFSGTKYVTSSTFCSQLSKIAICLDKYSNEPCFKPLHKSMKSKYDKYWKHVPLVLGLASIMDPRIKISALDFCIDLNSQPSPENPSTQSQEQTQPPFAQNIPQPNPQRPPKPVIPVKGINFYLTKLDELFEIYQMKMNTPANLSEEASDMVEDEDPYYALLSQRREASKQTCKTDLQRYLDQPAIVVRNNKATTTSMPT
ncbi:hypothetical protein ACHQM5_014189 [Ranunculus cassubicifolius]